MHKAGIIGASGYTGYELIKILSKHLKVKLVVLNSKNYAGKKVKELYPDFDEDLEFTDYPIEEINDMNLDAVFLAVPHTTAMEIVPKLKCKIIDLSADYRFKNVKEYEKVYKVEHKDKDRKAIYGLPELFIEEIKKARIVANPGCYATGMILSAYPIQEIAEYIIYDCKSGWSGAGKSSVYARDSSIIKDNLIAYKLVNHRHKYEVEQFIKSKISFTPHVIDTFQGMMITAHALLKKKEDVEKIKEKYREFYKECKFTHIVDEIPDLHAIQGNNKCLIGGFEIDENNQLVIVTVLDNLLKGASGQAVQNMNIMLGFKEEEGL
ncbi:MAG: N-acetyl-gamma-glutamyl-phosphate reductase [Nanoarchaeota archaeon]|nr:N-acetyl-gamma-glutamyl-phosphate reductase [Nanoarchaeota archaeon]